MSKKRSKESIFNEKYLKQYKSWKKAYCPALKSHVYFTNKGWQHLQQEKWRSRSEKEERLKALGVAKHIIETTSTIQDRKLQPRKGVLHDHVRFTALIGGVKYGVVVIEDKGQYDFLSVFKV